MRTTTAIAFLALLLPLGAGAAGGGVPLMHADVDVSDHAAVQRGAASFVNYCMGCHSLKYLRYQRLNQDIGIPEETIQENLIWTPDTNVLDPMTNAMTVQQAEAWFGAPAPDLTLSTRRRGEDWVYTYLNTFYRDDSASTGTNNLVLAGASMPHVLWRLQGIPEAEREDGRVVGVSYPEEGGTLSEEEYQAFTNDLVTFLAYAAEPVRETRQQMGIWVIAFLLVFLVVAIFLKKEYWKDIH